MPSSFASFGLLAAKSELEELRAELKSAVEREDYESAALLRDKIKDIGSRGEM